MVKIDGIGNPQEWIEEHELPPASDEGVGDLIRWVADIDEEAEKQGNWPATKGDLIKKRDLIMHVLRSVFQRDMEEPDYMKIRLQAEKDAREREKRELESRGIRF